MVVGKYLTVVGAGEPVKVIDSQCKLSEMADLFVECLELNVEFGIAANRGGTAILTPKECGKVVECLSFLTGGIVAYDQGMEAVFDIWTEQQEHDSAVMSCA